MCLTTKTSGQSQISAIVIEETYHRWKAVMILGNSRIFPPWLTYTFTSPYKFKDQLDSQGASGSHLEE